MKEFLITRAIGVLINMVDEDLVNRGIGAMFDYIESEVKDSDNDVDDRLVLPVLRTLRSATGTK